VVTAPTMHSCVQEVHELLSGLIVADVLEAEHRSAALSWLESTNDVFRRVKPATPAQHLVSYVVLADPSDGSTLLVDHVKAGLWLPPGGHVEPGEHPARTARRELREELGIEADFADGVGLPSFVTITRTVGKNAHVDVSLWFTLLGQRGMTLTPDHREFNETRWWTPTQVFSGPPELPPEQMDPHYRRFVKKMLS
jgi:8-oxo-dGTP diphosphatase